ncbi:MAG: HAMP domain-containing histidine kinase [Candidatus Riflebacteria bacterium]|nr:HAMP domain-containing histidine kinase [Candidatus Riflebacteria bacterium]
MADNEESSRTAYTYTPPRGRTSLDKLAELLQGARAEQLVTLLVGSIPGPVAILNEHRQIVLANEPFMKLAGKAVLDEVFGLRQGEALGCDAATKGPDGCGTGEACAFCGAANALCKAGRQAGATVVKECLITVQKETLGALELEVAATRACIAGQTVFFLALRDVSGEKRRRLFEATFFHDVLNTAGGMKCLAQRLAEDRVGNDDERLLLQVANQLVEEIQFHRQLAAAESGDLSCQWHEVVVQDLLVAVRDLYAKHSLARGKTISVEAAPGLSIVTDRVILQRVLGNLLKNALEASSRGARVTLSVKPGNDGGVELSVHNEGAMPREVQLQMFKRSFSTKAEKGRGIGTYSVRLFTQDFLRGRVSFSSSDAAGTTFLVWLPREPTASTGPGLH